MTTGTDPAQPAPTDQPTLVAPAAADAPAQSTDASVAAAAERMAADPDLIELSEAIKAVKVEEAAKPADPATDPAQSAQPAATPSATDAPADPAAKQQQQAAAPPMIPKPRFDEVNQRATKAEQDAAYWRGVAEARGQQQPQPGQQQTQQTQQPKPEDRLAEIHSKQDAIATQFDNGELTLAEVTKQQRELTKAETAIREELLLAKVPKPTAAQPSTNELYLDTLTANIEVEHPMVLAFDKVANDGEWGFVKSRAIEQLVARGIDPTKGDIGKYNLRKEMAVVIDDLGPALIGERAKAAGIELPTVKSTTQGQQQQQPANGDPKSRAAKLALAAASPPNLSTARASGEDPSAPSDSRIETMSDDEIAALPAAVRSKFLGSAA